MSAGALGHYQAAQLLTGVGGVADIGHVISLPCTSAATFVSNNTAYILRGAGSIAEATGETQVGGLLRAMAGMADMTVGRDPSATPFDMLANMVNVAGNVAVAVGSDELAANLLMLSEGLMNVSVIADFLKPQANNGAEPPNILLLGTFFYLFIYYITFF